MCRFVDLRDKFLTKEIYTIYAPCMYQPTWEKFCKKAKHYVENKNIFIMGAITENTIAGVIVLEKQSDGHLFEILGIAVDAALRQQGIGRKMVRSHSTTGCTPPESSRRASTNGRKKTGSRKECSRRCALHGLPQMRPPASRLSHLRPDERHSVQRTLQSSYPALGTTKTSVQQHRCLHFRKH